MIHNLHLQNFKCFREQKIDFGPLTLLSGLNGMGKSSVIQALLLLRQSNSNGNIQRLRLNGGLVSLGTTKDVLYEDAAIEQIGIGVRLDTYPYEEPDKNHPALFEHTWMFDVQGETDVLIADDQNQQYQHYPEIDTAALFGGPFHYLNAERLGPRTSFATSDYEVRQLGQLGTRGEFTAQYLAINGNRDIPNPNAQHPAAASLSLSNQVEAWLGEISPGTRLNLNSVPDMDVVGLRFSFTRGRDESKPYRATNVGFGLTYTLPILVATLATPPGGLIIIENPEAHLHPRGQAMVGELLARAAQGGVQIIIETHSDHVLNGIRLAVHGGGQASRLNAEAVQLHFFQRRSLEIAEDGSARVEHAVFSPHMDRDGRIDSWPDGFFDEWDRSLEALLEPRAG